MSKKTKTIFIVDDNEYILKPLSTLLSGLGYLVKTTTNGKDPKITKKPFANLILLDMRLKDICGQDVCLRIKENKETCHIPVIMFSADNRGKIISKGAGADDFIEKPFVMSNLIKKIEKHIS